MGRTEASVWRDDRDKELETTIPSSGKFPTPILRFGADDLEMSGFATMMQFAGRSAGSSRLFLTMAMPARLLNEVNK